MNVINKIKEDISELFYKVLIDDYDGVSNEEIKEIKSFILLLINYFPSELRKANEKCESNCGKVLVRK